MPASAALKATWPGDAWLPPPTVTRSVSATRASCAAVMDGWASMKVRCGYGCGVGGLGVKSPGGTQCVMP